jgi:hypothetical protein
MARKHKKHHVTAVATNQSYVEKDIPIANLKLDELNFRTDEVDSQRAAIRAMIDEQGDALIALAVHCLNHGLAPGERLLVIPDDEEGEVDSFVVMEGNRRTTAMKLLENPSLAVGTKIHGRFAELAREFSLRPRRSLPCVILPDREIALVWVEVKHSTGMNGAGVEKWSADGTARFREFVRGEVTRWRATLSFLRGQGIDVKSISIGIKGKTTAITRVLDTKAMRERLGVIFSQDGAIEFENGDTVAGAYLLATMMKTMAEPSFSTNTVHSFDARTAFIEKFIHLATKLPPIEKNDENHGKDWGNSAIPKPSKDDSAGENKTAGNSKDGQEIVPSTSVENSRGKGQGVRRHPRERKTLASTSRGSAFSISDDRLNQLYIEARRLQVEKHTAIAAVLLRVFLELSCEHYLSSKKVPLPDSISHRGGGRINNWHSFGVKLREKIEAAVSYAEASGGKLGFEEIRRGLGSQDHLHSPENLHSYVHGLKVIPSDRDLIIIWDRYHPLFSRIFS